MTLECYWEFNYNGTTTKIDQEPDPLIVKWVDKLGLREEPIKIVIEHKDGYAGVKLHFDPRKNSWFITNNALEEYHTLHKLGYVWFWKITGIIEQVKKEWRNKTNLDCLPESAVIDNIVFSRFCNMDEDFKDFWVNFTVEECRYWYNGASWYKDLPDMLYSYVVNNLNYNFVWSEDLKNKYSSFIMVELLKRRSEILEKSQIESVLFTKKDLRVLDRILRNFDSIVGSIDYKKIERYVLQLSDFFNKLT